MKKEKRVKLERGELGMDIRPHIPDPRIKSEELIIPRSAEEIKARAERESEILKLRAQSINEKPCFHNTLQMINVEEIQDSFSDWNHFDLPDQMEQYDMMRSIENVGLLNPIYCTIDRDGRYSVIIGRVRLIAYCNLYEKTGFSDKYKYIPSYVINLDEIDELQIRTMMIESNISFRKISKFNMIRALIENYQLMKECKKFRNEKNVGMEIAKLFNVSEATTFNFLKTRNLCDTGLALLYDEKITLQVATYLAKVTKETQEKILDSYGVDGVKAIHRLKMLTGKKDIKMEDLEKLLKRIEKLEPYMTTISITVCSFLLDAFLKYLLEFKERDAKLRASVFSGRFNNVFKTKFNRSHMGYYLEAGKLDEVTVKRLLAKSIKKMEAVK
ncbi:MAG: ParB N-terminal domain-containing protein [Oscillospiraceae bacterium]|nr:ParB N-terminal domain-containing protein [Oscillospiraceae bacterium]